MDSHLFKKKCLGRIKAILKKNVSSVDRNFNFKISRAEARNLTSIIQKCKEKNIVDRALKQRIKKYCKKRFKDSSYWPWLALYTEIRGEFIEGWIPNDFYRFNLLPKLNPEKFMRMSEAKTLDPFLFNNFDFSVQLLRIGGKYYDKNGSIITENEVNHFFAEEDSEFVIKSDAGRSGKGIIFKQSKEINLNKLPTSVNLIFQKSFKQHEILRMLFPHSVNTFRVTTHLKRDGTIDVKFMILRFGVGNMRMDNISAGGGWVQIKKDGSVGNIAYKKNGIAMGVKHPDTGIKFSEIELPLYKDIISLCKKAHDKFPFVGIIGWDVYVDQSGKPNIIEWNANNPGFWQFEALLGPLFTELPN